MFFTLFFQFSSVFNLNLREIKAFGRFFSVFQGFLHITSNKYTINLVLIRLILGSKVKK
jgi:hypothetical protein